MPKRKTNKNILFVVSRIYKAISHEWTAEELIKRGYAVHFALLNSESSKMENHLKLNRIEFIRIKYRTKFDIPIAILSLKHFIKKHEIEIVHTHLFEGGLVGSFAAKLVGVSKRIYTRHHSTFHHTYFPNMVRFDRLINSASTHIVAPSEVVKNVLRLEKVDESKIHLIHHGFKLDQFLNVESNRIDRLKIKFNIKGNPIVGVIARWTAWKGIQYIIPAFKKFLDDYPDAQLILSNSKGDYSDKINQLLEDLPTKSYRVIYFEEDFVALYKLFDVFVHVPINSHAEAFGQVYVEALAAGIPSIFTLSGVANEFIQDHIHALIVPYQNAEGIYQRLIQMTRDTSLSKNLVQNGRSAVYDQFQFIRMVNLLDSLYQK